MRLLTIRVAACAALSLAPLSAAVLVEGDLPRRAELGFTTRHDGGALVVRAVTDDSAAAAAGLRAGDRIIAVDGRGVEAPHYGLDLLRRLDGGVRIELAIERDGARRAIAFAPPPLPLEEIAGLDTAYGVVDTLDGARLRTVVTRPRGASGPLPAIFLMQWVSCDGVEPLGDRPFHRILRTLAQRSGAVMIRVERSSGGDSEGPGCHELDYETELAHYRHAFDTLTAAPSIDRDRIVVYGTSLGSTLAPLLAAERRMAGVAVSGGGALTYFERMLAFDRLGFELGGTPPGEIDERMRRHAEFLLRYLHHDEDPEAIARSSPELGGVWSAMRGTGDGVHYGRPYAWHRQLAKRDLYAAWSRVTAPVLVVYGELDQFEPPHALRAAAEMLDRLRPGQARAVEIPYMNHFYEIHPTAEDAAQGRYGQPADELVAGSVLAWLRGVIGFPVDARE